MTSRNIPSKEQVKSYLTDRRNWGRWGAKGGAGATNLITPAKRLEATKLIRTGKTVSLSMPLSVEPSPRNPRPVQHYMKSETDANGRGGASDYVGIYQHGYSVTHMDALCHMWDKDGMWDGKDPKEEITFNGAKYGSVDQFKDGIVTRGVLLDVPKYREKPHVTLDSPVHGWELEEIASSQDVEIRPGDAVIVFCGRKSYMDTFSDGFTDGADLPGLHGSCLPFIRDNDVALLGWDMLDAVPNDSGVPMPMHSVINSYGVPILDNTSLENLSSTCLEENRYEFFLTVNPLVIVGGTGSPVNPIAIF